METIWVGTASFSGRRPIDLWCTQTGTDWGFQETSVGAVCLLLQTGTGEMELMDGMRSTASTVSNSFVKSRFKMAIFVISSFFLLPFLLYS